MTVPDTVRRFSALLAITAATLTATACGGDTSGSAEWVAPSSNASVTATPASARLKNVTSACELLPAKVVVDVLGSSQGTKLTAKEEPADQNDSEPTLSCTYVGKGEELLAVTAIALKDRAETGQETVDAIAGESGAKITRLDGPGEHAVTYTSEGARFLVFAVPYESELRVVLLVGPPVIPVAKYGELAEHVAPKL